MTTQSEAAIQALEAWSRTDQEQRRALSITLSEPEKQPVAWLYWDSWGTLKLSQIMPPPVGAFPVYTTPPAADDLIATYEKGFKDGAAQRQWVGLTDTQIEQVYFEMVKKHRGAPMPWGQVQFGKALEAKLKEKNHG